MSIRSWVRDKPADKRQQAIARLANACDVTPSAVRHWVSGQRQVPPQKCAVVEELTGIPRESLRPDVFGQPEARNG
jgi:DNA-binding transcriptional regulator YdaS (Cro superfamily)